MAKVAANDYFFLGCASQFGMPYHEEYNNSRSKEQAITYYRKAALLDNDITIRRVAHNRWIWWIDSSFWICTINAIAIGTDFVSTTAVCFTNITIFKISDP